MSSPAIVRTLPGAASESFGGGHPEILGGTVATDERDLSTLTPGQEAVIEGVDSSTPVGRRLLDLGFVANTIVRVVRRAPLRDPVEYELRGTRICLRRTESLLIRVRQVTTP